MKEDSQGRIGDSGRGIAGAERIRERERAKGGRREGKEKGILVLTDAESHNGIPELYPESLWE